MSTPQQAKIDLIVSMAGSSPADAKKLLDTLKDVEKVEKEIAANSEKHAKSLEQRKKASQASMQKGMGVVGGAMSGGPLGAMSAMGGNAGAISGVVNAAEQGLNKLARAAEICATANTTAAQRQRMITEELIPFGSALTKLSDAITGVTEAIFQRNQQFAIKMASIDIRARGDQQQRALGSELGIQNHRLRAQAGPGGRLDQFQTFDRGTVGGMHGVAEQGMMLPARDAARSARVEATAARGMYETERGREGGLREKLGELEGNRRELRNNLQHERSREEVFGARRNQAGINSAAAAVQENERAIAAQIAAINEQILRTKEAGVKAAEAESRSRRAMIDIQKAELEVLKAREQRMAAIQQAAGGMTRGGFAASSRAVEQVRRRGVGNVSARTAELAGQLAPEFVARQREALGGQRMEAMRGRMGAENFGQVYGRDFAPGNTLADTRRNMDRVTADVRVAVQLDERAMANEIVRVLDPIFARLVANVEAQLRQSEADIRAGAIRSGNATNGAAR